LGQLAIVHSICAVSSFILFSALMYGNVVKIIDIAGLSLIILGAMIIFSRKLEKFEGA
jgi:hypothetical protein